MRWYRSRAMPRFAARAAVAAAAAACGGSSDADHDAVTAVVFGTVTLASGSPAAGARLGAFSYNEGCSGLVVGGSDWAFTDDRGAYRLQIRDISRGPRSMCVGVLVTPGPAGVTDTVRVTGPTLAFRLPQSGEPEDSARVDVRLP